MILTLRELLSKLLSTAAHDLLSVFEAKEEI